MNEYSNKLSSATKRILSQAPKNENPTQTLLIRIDGELNEERRSQLNRLVIEIRSVAGDVVVVTASLQEVPRLAMLEFVNYIEVPSPMYRETKGPSVP